MAAPTSPDQAVVVPETQRALRRRIVGLAAPIVGENVLELTLDLVNTALVASIGAAAIAAVGGATQVMFVVFGALSALSAGTSVLVSQAVGAGDTTRASRLARQSLVWCLVLGLPVAVAGGTFTNATVAVFGMAPDVAGLCASYLRVAMGTLLVLTALTILGGVLRGAGDSRTPMWAALVANVLNVPLAGALIYGWAGLPHLGVVGAAWATFAARSVALLIVGRKLWRGHAGVSLAQRTSWRPDVRIARRILALGLPSAGEQLVISMAWAVFTFLIARLGTDALAAQRVAMSVLSMCFLPTWGRAPTLCPTTVLVGQSVGARRFDIARRVARLTALLTLGWMVAAGAVVFVFADDLMRVFTHSPGVISTGAATLRVMVFSQPCWGLAMSSSGGLRGMSDTRTPLIVEAIGNWSSITMLWLMVENIHATLPLAWGAVVVVGPFIGGTLWHRMLRRARLLEAGEITIELPATQHAAEQEPVAAVP